MGNFSSWKQRFSGVSKSLKAVNFSKTSSLKPLRGHWEILADIVLEKISALDFPPSSICLCLRTFTVNVQTALLFQTKLRTPLNSSSDASNLRASRLEDVFQAPGGQYLPIKITYLKAFPRHPCYNKYLQTVRHHDVTMLLYRSHLFSRLPLCSTG